MSDKYQQVKNIFSKVFDREPMLDIRVSKYHTISDYIKAVYEHIHTEHYGEMTKAAINFLGISRTELDDLLLEIICSNLHCDAAIISQIIGDKGKRHEYFLSDVGVFGSEDKKTTERFRKRLNPERLTVGKRKIVLPTEENYTYYIPTLAEVFRETLFVRRKDIFDISEVFIDIFKALFYDTDDQANDDSRASDIALIKSYRLWEYTTSTLVQVSDIYRSILNGKSAYKYAELNLIEKLFGLTTLSSILSKKIIQTELPFVVDELSSLHLLGYCTLTERIASKVNKNNLSAFSHFVEEYLYPLCTDCITTVLCELIAYIGRLEMNKRVEYVDTFLKACQKYIVYKISEATIENAVSVKPDLTLKLFKRLHHLPEPDDKEAIREYLLNSYMDYSDERCILEDNGQLTLISNVAYKDLSYLKEYIGADYYEDPTNDEIKKHFRGK